MNPVSVLVTIVNYRTAELTIDAIASLEAEVVARGDTHVVVVDNGSADGSAEKIGAAISARGFARWCTLHAVERNGGFAAGNNEGLACYQALVGDSRALPDFVWLLNPDTIARPDAIGGLVRFMEAHPKVGIAGGRCFWEDGRVRSSAFYFHSPRSELVAGLAFGPATRLLGGREIGIPPDDRPIQADWVSGSSFMIRRAVIETIGLMDERYFLYFEEEDYCARAADAGFTCWSVPESRIVHIGGQSTGLTGPARLRRRRPRYWFAARGRFFLRRHGLARTHLANGLWLLAYPIGEFIGLARKDPRRESPRLWWDFLYSYYGPGGLMYHARELGA